MISCGIPYYTVVRFNFFKAYLKRKLIHVTEKNIITNMKDLDNIINDVLLAVPCMKVEGEST